MTDIDSLISTRQGLEPVQKSETFQKSPRIDLGTPKAAAGVKQGTVNRTSDEFLGAIVDAINRFMDEGDGSPEALKNKEKLLGYLKDNYVLGRDATTNSFYFNPAPADKFVVNTADDPGKPLSRDNLASRVMTPEAAKAAEDAYKKYQEDYELTGGGLAGITADEAGKRRGEGGSYADKVLSNAGGKGEETEDAGFDFS